MEQNVLTNMSIVQVSSLLNENNMHFISEGKCQILQFFSISSELAFLVSMLQSCVIVPRKLLCPQCILYKLWKLQLNMKYLYFSWLGVRSWSYQNTLCAWKHYCVLKKLAKYKKVPFLTFHPLALCDIQQPVHKPDPRVCGFIGV